MPDVNPPSQKSARTAIEHYVEAYWQSRGPEVTRLGGTIYTAAAWIGRGYTVTRNALNALVRDGKCVRKEWSDGTYQYTFERPVVVPGPLDIEATG